MSSFELAFNDTERAAASTIKSAASLGKLAKRLEKAAKEGNIAAIKRAQGELGNAVKALAQEMDNAVKVWPFQDDEEERYLRDDYAAELRAMAAQKGLTIYERDGRLVSHPSMVRIQPGDRAVRIDRKKVSTIRPSHLVSLLLENQKKPGRFGSGPFLESLYEVYSELIREDDSDRLVRGTSRVVPLERIYKLLTSLPGSSREYDRTDFARDLYLLETSGPTKTKSGATVSFPASTGTKSGRGLFTFVEPDGRDVLYYGVRFTEEG